jgi:hypothetical protein
MKQTIGNACGTIGILHAVGNNLGRFNLTEGSYFKEYFAKTAGMTPVERAAYLEEDDGIEAAHGVSGGGRGNSFCFPLCFFFAFSFSVRWTAHNLCNAAGLTTRLLSAFSTPAA